MLHTQGTAQHTNISKGIVLVWTCASKLACCLRYAEGMDERMRVMPRGARKAGREEVR